MTDVHLQPDTHTQKRKTRILIQPSSKMMEHNSTTSYILLSVSSHPKTFRVLHGFVLMEDLGLKLKRGPGKITQLLRVLAAFSEDLGSGPSMMAHTDMELQLWCQLLASRGACMHVHIHSHTPTQKIKIVFKA